MADAAKPSGNVIGNNTVEFTLLGTGCFDRIDAALMQHAGTKGERVMSVLQAWSLVAHLCCAIQETLSPSLLQHWNG